MTETSPEPDEDEVGDPEAIDTADLEDPKAGEESDPPNEDAGDDCAELEDGEVRHLDDIDDEEE